MLPELTPEHILALGTAVSAAIGGIILAARQSARSGPTSAQTHGSSALLVLDAERVKALIDALGLMTVQLATVSRDLTGNSQEARDTRAAIERAAEDIRDMTKELVRGQGRR